MARTDMDDISATMAFNQLSQYHWRHDQKKVMILLDEYDTRMQKSYVNGCRKELTAYGFAFLGKRCGLVTKNATKQEIFMRNETQVLNLLLTTAKADNRILAVYMNGSRTNPNVPKDIFQDYDIVFVVTETRSFIEDKSWIHQFGTILYMQYPDESPDDPGDKDNFYGWLMQFDDGVRIDLHVETVSHAKEFIRNDKLCSILWEKEPFLPSIPPATDVDYHVKKPSHAQFCACINEFWWCSNNLAKGLWREEMPYVQDMANFVVRKQLERMLSWKVGIKTNFQVSVGKSAKYLYRWLDKEEYQAYLNTWFGGNISDAWEAVFRMCHLFDAAVNFVSKELRYEFNEKERQAALLFLKHVRSLPRNASQIFEKQNEQPGKIPVLKNLEKF